MIAIINPPPPSAPLDAIFARLVSRRIGRGVSVAQAFSGLPTRSSPEGLRYRDFEMHSYNPATPMDKDFAFEMAVSSVRFGAGVTREVGMDLKELGATLALVVT